MATTGPYLGGRDLPRSVTAASLNASCSPSVMGNTATIRSAVTSDGTRFPCANNTRCGCDTRVRVDSRRHDRPVRVLALAMDWATTGLRYRSGCCGGCLRYEVSMGTAGTVFVLVIVSLRSRAAFLRLTGTALRVGEVHGRFQALGRASFSRTAGGPWFLPQLNVNLAPAYHP
jgi:hypothetical protein